MGGLADFVSGILGGSKSEDIHGQMIREAQSIPLPILKEYYPELYQQVVSLNPEMDSAVNLGPSQMAGISTDPALRQMQLKALGKLQEIGDAGGRDAQFLADQARIESDINANTQGQMGAIQQNMAARGLSGGMSEMVARNQAAQQGANRQAQMGLDANAQAQQRALQAIMQGGQLGGQMQQQDFSQQSQKAQAADAIAKFNAANTQNVQSQNVHAKNQAQQWNASNAQDTANQNTGARNDAQLRNNEISQREYENRLRKQGMINEGYVGQGRAADERQNRNNQFLGNLISGGFSAYGGGKK